MTQYLAKIFGGTEQNNNSDDSDSGRQLPSDFAQQILNNDIIFVLSNYTNNDALSSLVRLYMLGIEYYKELQDMAYQYFQIKLHHLMDNVPTPPPPPVKSRTPQAKNKVELTKLQIHQNTHPDSAIVQHKPFVSMQTFKDPSNQFTFLDTPDCAAIKQEVRGSSYKTSAQITDHDENYGERQASETDEKKENMAIQMKQEMFFMDEQKEARDMVNKHKGEQEHINKIINTEFVAQSSKFAKRLERRQTISSFATINKANSQPNLEQMQTPNKQHIIISNLKNASQQILEDPMEQLSSKLPSSQKNPDVNQFQFKTDEDSHDQ